MWLPHVGRELEKAGALGHGISEFIIAGLTSLRETHLQRESEVTSGEGAKALSSWRTGDGWSPHRARPAPKWPVFERSALWVWRLPCASLDITTLGS